MEPSIIRILKQEALQIETLKTVVAKEMTWVLFRIHINIKRETQVEITEI